MSRMETTLLSVKSILYAVAGMMLIGVFIGVCSAKTTFKFNTCPQGSGTLRIPGKIYKPKGMGPFPAVIILHGCGGLDQHHAHWAKLFVEWGYAAFTIDSFRPRRVSNVCNKPREIGKLERALDVFCAATSIQALPYIDGKKIGIIGFSHGGGAVLQSVKAETKVLAGMDAFPFKAAVAFYPYCEGVFYQDLSIPTLVLIGEKDKWTPAKGCRNLKQWVTQSELYDVVVYPGTYHSFDRVKPRRFYMGHRLEHSPKATRDAKKRTRDFFASI